MLGAKNGDLSLIYAGRVLAGIGVGGASNLSPIFISEMAPPAIRGRLVGLYEFCWQIGGLVGFWINYGVNTTMVRSTPLPTPRNVATSNHLQIIKLTWKL
jgi:MFS family permease